MKAKRFDGRLACLCLLWLASTIVGANAAIPRTMSYQGVLTDAGGAVVPDGAYNLDFRLYDALSGGVPLWTETQASVPVAGGELAVMLGAVVPLSLPFDQPYWLGIAVNGEPELTPRLALGASPYALAVANQPGLAQVRLVGSSVTIGNGSTLARELTVTITIPAAGYINVDAFGMIGFSFAVGEQSMIYGIKETAALTWSPEPGYFYYCGFGTAPNTNYLDFPFYCRRTYYKSAAGSYTFSLGTGRLGSFNSDTYLYNPVLTAVYLPAAYGTVTTAVAAGASVADPHGLGQQEDPR